jgi:hypothetical protein
MSRAQDVIDLFIDRVIGDQLLPHMSRLAWSAKFRPLLPLINNIINEAAQEARTDTLRESTDD